MDLEKMLWSKNCSEFCKTSLDAPQNPQRLPIFYPVFKDAPMLSAWSEAAFRPPQHPAASTAQDIQTNIQTLSCKRKFAGTRIECLEGPV